MAFLTWIANGFRWLAGWVLPFFAQAKDFKGIGPAVRWAIHILVVALILGVLFYVQHLEYLQPYLRGPLTITRDLWLPLLFVLVYLLSWLGWWMWQLLQPEGGPAFPDIDAAWEEAVAALHSQGIDLTEAPLFLVLGRPAGGEMALFEATRLSLPVRNAPARPDAPLHVFGNRDAIYVTCAGASLLGRQAAVLAEEPAPSPFDDRGPASGDGFSRGGEDEVMQSIGMRSIGVHSVGVGAAGMDEIREILRRAEAEGRTTTEAEKQRIEQLMGGGGAAARPAKARPQLLRDSETTERLTARLEHLCGLILRDRSPWCPLNGMIVLVPLAATDNDEDANHTAEVCRRDLDTVRRAARIQCPIVILLSDMERAVGFPDLIAAFPKDERHNRLGRSFPMAPDLDPAKAAQLIAAIPGWIVHSLLASRLYKFLRLDQPGRSESDGTALEVNYRLLQLLQRAREREKRLGLILTRATEGDPDERMLFWGCYLIAAGQDRDQEQAFVPGVFQKVTQNQHCVSWTQQALADEATYARWTQYGYVALAAFVALVAGAVAFAWRRG